MKDRTDIEFFQVFRDLHENLITRGINPTYIILKNPALPSNNKSKPSA